MISILKFNFLVFAMLAVNTTLSAQESNPARNGSGVAHEIGINATFLIQKLIGPGASANANAAAYAITYRRIKSNRGIFRAGFGINGTSVQSDDFGAPTRTTSFTINTRLGVERQFELGKQWSASFGGDLRNNFHYVQTKRSGFQGDSKAFDETYLTGLGPVLGIRFHINEKIGLYTETVFLTSLDVEKSTTEFNPIDSSKSKKTVFSTTFGLPTSLYLTIKL